MKRSTDRILTSHAGSLARPLDLLEMIRKRINGETLDEAAFAERKKSAVREIVWQQADCGIDIVNDGELSKPMFADYVVDRIAGFEGANPEPAVPFVRGGGLPDAFPQLTAWRAAQSISPVNAGLREKRPMCIGPLSWKDRAYETDIANLKAAVSEVSVADAFLPSPSPGIIAMRIPNAYYKSEEEYLYAIADVLKDEYKAIIDAGFVLQIDAPDAAMSWDRQTWSSLDEFRAALEIRTAALNHALDGLPEEQIRFHVCWGNNESPHTRDIALRDIVDIVLKVHAAAYSVEAANPRHGHEWKVWEDVKLPEGKVLMPGVIDSLTLFVEHPELVAQRIVQYARIVGRERVIAGVDCGFGTGASANPRVHPEVVLAKFRSLSEGAKLASAELWR